MEHLERHVMDQDVLLGIDGSSDRHVGLRRVRSANVALQAQNRLLKPTLLCLIEFFA